MTAIQDCHIGGKLLAGKFVFSSFLLIVALLLSFIPAVHATTLGMNYYHETMGGSFGRYIPRTSVQVSEDLDTILTVTDHVKLYANPFFDTDTAWMLQVAGIAKIKTMHVVLTMNTEDRLLDDSNWKSYQDKVLLACANANGKADEFLVGNEIALHSPWTAQQIHDHVVPLMAACAVKFNGPVSYEEFYYARGPWLADSGKIYLNMYEHLPTFLGNLHETTVKLGNRLAIGEFGEMTDGGPSWPGRGETWQANDVMSRWQLIKQSGVGTAYVFTYKEPSDTGFGLVYANGTKKLLWYLLQADVKGMLFASPPDNASTNVAPVVAPGAPASNTTANTSAFPGVPESSTTNPPVSSPVVPAPPSASSSSSTAIPLQSLSTSCMTLSGQCVLVRDYGIGSCRRMYYAPVAASQDYIIVQVCDKGDHYEVYRYYAPDGLTFSACVGGGCVDEVSGFDSFSRADITATPSLPPGQTSPQIPVVTPVIPPSSAVPPSSPPISTPSPSPSATTPPASNPSPTPLPIPMPTTGDLTSPGGSAGGAGGAGGSSAGSSPKLNVASLTISCAQSQGGPSCTAVSELNDGACRVLEYRGAAGAFARVKTCEKPFGYELYLLTPQASSTMVVCADGHCVGPKGAFSRWNAP